MQPYLVTIDTTNRNMKRHVEDRDGNRMTIEPALSSNTIHNFYVILANSEEEARRIVAGTFNSKPRIMNEVYEVAQVTPLDRIVKSLNSRMNAWSYIPMNKSIRLPGQQFSPIPMLSPEQYENGETQQKLQMPRVVSPVIEEDVKPPQIELTAEDQRVLTAPAPPAPTMPANMTPEMMQMMMTMMQQMMNGQVPQVKPAKSAEQEKHETQMRIQENLRATREGINQKVAGFNVPPDVVNAQSEILPDDEEEIAKARAELYKNRSATPKSITRTAGMTDEDVLNSAP